MKGKNNIVFVEESVQTEMPTCRINILRKGDQVIGYDKGVIVVRRKNGETDLINIVVDPEQKRVDAQLVATIGYGDGEVEFEAENGDTVTFF